MILGIQKYWEILQIMNLIKNIEYRKWMMVANKSISKVYRTC